MSEESLFYYEKGLSYQNFSHPEFQPIFLDEVDKDKLDIAKEQCGSNPSQACIFDYLATGDIALAQSSGKEEASAQLDMKIIGQDCPTKYTTLVLFFFFQITLTWNLKNGFIKCTDIHTC